MIELIPLELQYCEAVEEIAKECLPEHWSLEGIRDTLKYDSNVYYIAKDTEQNVVVGFAGIMVIVDEAELLNIAITNNYRRLGIGQRLLDQLIEDAKNRNAGRLLLEVRQSNLPALAFYSNNNFVAIGERKNYYNNPTENAVIMEKLF